MITNLKELKKIIATVYTRDKLHLPLKRWVIGFIKRNKILYQAKGLNSVVIMLENRNSRNKFNSDESLTYFTSVFVDREIFTAFFDYLSEPLRIGFRELALADELYNHEMSELTGINAKESDFNMFPQIGYYWNPVYQMPYALKKLILSHLGYYDYNLEPLNKIEKTDVVYHGEEHVFEEMPLLLTYVKQQPIPTTKQGRPTAAGLKRVLKATKIKEFYNEKGMTGTIKTLLRLFLLLDLPKSKLQSLSSTKDMINYLVKGIYIKQRRNSVYDLFYFHKSIYKSTYNNQGLEDRMLIQLKKLPVNGWLAFDDIFNFLVTNCDIIPLSHSIAYNEICFYYSHSDHPKKVKDLYNHLVQQPFIKGTFFLFAALGLVDIAYDNNPEEPAFKDDVTNPYQKLKYVRLNDFGAYILGLTDSYDAPEQEFTNELYLSSEALVITTNENNPTAEIILKNYMTKVSNTRYVTDYETFLNRCSTVSDIRSKIKNFKNTLNMDFPENWEVFFTELIEKANSFQGRSFKVFELKKDSELIRLIARDEVLKSLVIKAENYHVLVKNKDLPTLRMRLLKFGYFLK